jgi:hypothetical protein
MPAFELESSRLNNSTNLFLILNGTPYFPEGLSQYRTVAVRRRSDPAAVANRRGRIFRD